MKYDELYDLDEYSNNYQKTKRKNGNKKHKNRKMKQSEYRKIAKKRKK